MALSKSSQRQARTALDEKLALQVPSREILESLAVECAANPSPDNTFQYAFCLSKSMENSELQYSITILDSLVKEGYEHQLDCMFGAAIALYLLRNFEGARNRCEAILRSEPDNSGTIELHLACVDAHEEEERMKRIATGGTAAIAAAGLILGVAGMLLKKR
jgi:fission 1 protein